MAEEPRTLTVDEALAVLPAPEPEPHDWNEDEDGEWEDLVHVYTNPAAGMLIGADWTRSNIVDAIRTADVRQIGGPACRETGHGLVVSDEHRWLFVEAVEERLAEYDPEPEPAP